MDINDVRQAARLVELRKSIKDVQAAIGADPTGAVAKITVEGAAVAQPEGGTLNGIRATMELDGVRMNRLMTFFSDLLTTVETRLTALGVTWTP